MIIKACAMGVGLSIWHGGLGIYELENLKMPEFVITTSGIWKLSAKTLARIKETNNQKYEIYNLIRSKLIKIILRNFTPKYFYFLPSQH